MKGIYCIYDNKLYREEPKQRVSCIESIMNKSDYTNKSDNLIKIEPSRKIKQFIELNDILEKGSNATRLEELKDTITNENIKSIHDLSYRFRVIIEYSIYDGHKLIEHSVVMKPVTFSEITMLNEINEDNEFIFNIIRMFKHKIIFTPRKHAGIGIIKEPVNEYKLKINDVRIHQFIKNRYQTNPSLYDFPHNPESGLLSVDLSNSIVIYSSKEASIDLKSVDLKFIPREIEININVFLISPVIIYDDTIITDLIQTNIDNESVQIEPDEEPNDNENEEVGEL